ncbi:murein biosynthesis integral membrane protein MurJ [Patescibacteria group bacterium]|nr:murein biosynthesis integral membrane protein MurJ [Patescibacteria group bacterium]
MKRVFSLFGREQRSVSGAALILMSMVFTSRILGLVRDRLLAARFSPDELGIYFAAFRIPNLLFELLVMGALTSAFIPVFTKYITQEKKEEAWRIASILVNLSFLTLLLVAVPVFIWSRQISHLMAPGFTGEQIDIMAGFTRFMIIFQVIPLLIGNFFTGILQSFNRFWLPAIAPVVYNIGIIAGIIVLTPALHLAAPVAGVGIGAFLFMAIQVPLLVHLGYRHRFTVDIRHKGVQEVGRLMAPRTLGLAVSQVDTTVDLILSSLLGARMVTIFNFAQHLQQLPVGLFGATIAQAALPSLSVSSAREEKEQFKRTIISSLHQIIFFVLPVSVLFIILRIPVVRLVFGAAQFDWEATVMTGMTLSAFSISLAAQAMVQVLARGFYALYDSKTPVVVGIVSIAVNSVLSILFIQVYHLPVWSLGLSTSVASVANGFFLFILLDRKIGGFTREELLGPVIKMCLAALAAGVPLFILLRLMDQLVFDTTRTFGLVLLTGFTGGIGLSIYVFIAWVLGVNEVQLLLNLITKVRRSRHVIFEPATEVINGGVQDKLS